MPLLWPKGSEDHGSLQLTPGSSQEGSFFFTKLPLELRRLIYEYAVGTEELQIKVSDEEEDLTTPFRLSCPAALRLFAFPGSCKLAYV